jgi:DNA-binding transcriptional MerR regulator
MTKPPPPQSPKPSAPEPGTLRFRLLRALDRSPYEPYTGSDEIPDRPPESEREALQSFSGKAAAAIVGITYRQLDYWARTDLIRPSLSDATGSGSRRRYSYRDLIELKLIKMLFDAGIKLESIREAFGYLREQLGEDLSTAKLVIAGTSAVLVTEDDELIDVVNRYREQGVLNLLTLDGIRDEVDAAIELFPAEAAPSSD